jgi:acyl dehydratase
LGVMNASTTNYMVVGNADPADWIGRSVEVVAPYPVERGRIGDFCSMVEDANPLYWDAELANRTAGGEVAPPAMLTGFRFPTPWDPRGQPEHGPVMAVQIPLPTDTLINVGLSCEFVGPILVGDRLVYRERIADISDRKETSLGTGWFITTDCEVEDTSGTRIARYSNTMLRYSRDGPDGARGTNGHPRHYLAPELGEELPRVTLQVTASLCALVVAATRDYFPGHHDRAYARRQGIADIFPNTGFYCGLTDRIALEWAGYRARLVRRDLRMFTPAWIGQTLHTGGRVLARREGDPAEVDLEVNVGTDHALVARANITLELTEALA